MYGQLSEQRKKQALSSIIPESLQVNKEIHELYFKNLIDLSNEDLGRGMLSHEKYCLFESINNINFQSKQAKVNLNEIDNIILTVSLKAYMLSKNNKHEGNIAFIMPPFSYAFPLLLSYHLILQHLVSSLLSNNEYKFSVGSGILIISDNIELLSHIWRTSINGNFLRDFFNIYTIEANTFKKFSFNNKRENSKIKNKDDGTLPWIALYRAYRKNLPEEIKKEADVIIVDLVPYRHRGRAEQIIKWAQEHSKHVIAIAPNFDQSTYKAIATFNNIIPVNQNSIYLFNNFFVKKECFKTNSITASWNIQASLPYLDKAESNIKIYNIIEANKVKNKIRDAFIILKRSYTKKGNLSKGFKRMKDMLIKLVSLPLPLVWYERTRLAEGKATLRQLINACEKIPTDTLEEETIKKFMMPHLKHKILEIYEYYYKKEGSPRGEVISNIVRANVSNRNKITIIVGEKLVAQEYKLWLRASLYLSTKDLSRIEVITQSDWARKQIREIFNQEDNAPSIIILTNPWNKKYLSSFYFLAKTKFYIVCGFYEKKIIDYQINMVFNKSFVKYLKNAFNNLFKVESKIWDTVPKNNKTSISIVDYKVTQQYKNEKKENSPIDKIDKLFEDEKLFNLMEDELDEEIDMNICEQISYDITSYAEKRYEYISCVKLHVNKLNEKKGRIEEQLIFVSRDKAFRVKRFDKDEVDSIGPFEFKRGDILIRLKQKERREIFDELLNMASNTLVMKWIELNVNEWQDMMKLIWKKFYSSYQSKSAIYQRILEEINAYGGNISSVLTIGNWIEGKVSLVRDEKNLYAIAKILKDEYYTRRIKSIYKAMKELWGIYIKLGKALGKIIMNQVNNISSNITINTNEWISLGKDIYISTQDVLEVLELLEVQQLEYEKEYLVHSAILEKVISKDNYHLIKKKGLLKYDEK
ncbi:DrmE family protein [Crassaminicella indica]|uniref:DrmE family protein n=1 Tax=Crassaminicella indica TaxID=2855394 RepID=A0ABX8RC55_9CLOT|nr:DrmE family protein [Crassaminicella indica]QXM06628.1 DrmE family protein [Crassaminicella indica]